MKIFVAKFLGLAGFYLAFLSATAEAADLNGVTISQIQVDDRPCVFFMLVGVSQVDPNYPGNPWVALPKSSANYSEMLSVIMSAKLGNKSIFLSTGGGSSCGMPTLVRTGLS